MTMSIDHPTACAEALFDAAFIRRAPMLTGVAESERHRSDLMAMAAACSPLATLLPPAMLDQQTIAQDRTFRSSHPLAMRRVALAGDIMVGRIIVDWQDEVVSYGLDIAVHPAHRSSGAGLAMLRAWIEVADRLGRRCTLDVIADNPAQRIYRRLGFVPVGSGEVDAPYVAMERVARGKAGR